MIKVNFNKWIKFLLLSAPFIDLINGAIIFLTNYQGISIGQISRIIFLIFNTLIIFKIDRKKFNYIIMIFIFVAFQMFFGILSGNLNKVTDVFSEMIFNIKFIYSLSLIILISSAFKCNIINGEELIKYTIKSIVLISSMLLITTLFNLNVSSYGDDAGSRGLFTDINAITSSLLIGLAFQLNIYFKNINKLKEFIKTCIILVATFLLGTKAAIFFSIILLLYFLIREIFSRKIFNSIGAIILGILIMFSIIRYFLYGNGVLILNRLVYFYENLNMVSFLLSARDKTLINIFPYWKSNIRNILIGTGYIEGSNNIRFILNGRGSIEMDFFDIYYFWGSIIGTITFISLISIFFKAIKNFIITKDYNVRVHNLIYIIIIICTIFGGHVLFSPLASMYFAIIYSINKYTEKGLVNE